MDIDRKFIIKATCREHDHNHTHEDAVLFLAKRLGIPDGAGSVRARMRRDRVRQYQEQHPAALKVPDIDKGPVGDIIIAPNP